MGVVPFHLFFDFEILVGQSLAHLLGLHRENALKRVLLRPQHLDFALVEIELFSKLADHVLSQDGGHENYVTYLERRQLALEI